MRPNNVYGIKNVVVKLFESSNTTKYSLALLYTPLISTAVPVPTYVQSLDALVIKLLFSYTKKIVKNREHITLKIYICSLKNYAISADNSSSKVLICSLNDCLSVCNSS